jgi:hypothetical protein
MFDVSIIKFSSLRKLAFFIHQRISSLTSLLGEKGHVNSMDILRIV